jgi:ribonucleoside-triphosphate reductase
MNKKNEVDVSKTIKEYLERSDWRVNANANQGYSLGGMILNTAGKVVANYWLHEIYDKANEGIAKAHEEGDYHIHDLDMLSGYCAGW